MARLTSAPPFACLPAVRAAWADPASPGRSESPFVAFGVASGEIERAYVVPLPRGRLVARALQGLDASGIPFDAEQRRASQDDPRAVAPAPDSPPAGDPAPDPARPDNDFEVRQALRVSSLLRAAAPAP